jgi:hypothetical protein
MRKRPASSRCTPGRPKRASRMPGTSSKGTSVVVDAPPTGRSTTVARSLANSERHRSTRRAPAKTPVVKPEFGLVEVYQLPTSMSANTAVPEDLEDELLALGHQPVAPPGLLGLLPGGEGEGVEEPAAPQSDVGQPGRALVDHPEQQVVERTGGTARGPHPHPGEHRCDLVAEGLERRLEEEVVLEAVAAAPVGDHLLLEPLEVEDDRSSAQRVEVLEGDRRRVRAVDRGEAGRGVQPETPEVGVEVLERHEVTVDEAPSRVPSDPLYTLAEEVSVRRTRVPGIGRGRTRGGRPP